MVFQKMEAICPDFKSSSFQMSDLIQNLDFLKTNLFLPIWNLDVSRFQIPTVHFLCKTIIASYMQQFYDYLDVEIYQS